MSHRYDFYYLISDTTLEPGDTDTQGNQYAMHDEFVRATEGEV